MKNPEGFQGIHPVIDKVSFAFKNKIAVYLRDGRVLLAPLQNFPSIERLTPSQRRKLTIVDDQLLLFQDCDEVFHLEQFLGREQEYAYHGSSQNIHEPAHS